MPDTSSLGGVVTPRAGGGLTAVGRGRRGLDGLEVCKQLRKTDEAVVIPRAAVLETADEIVRGAQRWRERPVVVEEGWRAQYDTQVSADADAIRAAGIDPRTRAEQLAPDAFVRLAEAIGRV